MSEITRLKNKILNGEKLSAFEVKHIIYSGNIPTVDEEMCEESRWFITYNLIINVDGRFFKISYLKAKSEMGEDETYDQYPIEVEQREVLIKKWIEKE